LRLLLIVLIGIRLPKSPSARHLALQFFSTRPSSAFGHSPHNFAFSLWGNFAAFLQFIFVWSCFTSYHHYTDHPVLIHSEGFPLSPFLPLFACNNERCRSAASRSKTSLRRLYRSTLLLHSLVRSHSYRSAATSATSL
jgi:hypothetical protein